MLRAGSLSTIAACAFLATPAMAIDLILPLTQQRSVHVNALAVDNLVPESDQDADSLSALDFSPFDCSLSALASLTNANATSAGSQNSEILGSSLQVVGSTSSSAESYAYDAYGISDGISRYEVMFDVTEISAFTLSGEIASLGQGSTSLTLDDASGPVFQVSTNGTQTIPILETGFVGVEHATHVLMVETSSEAFADDFIALSGSASCEISFTLARVTGVATDAHIGNTLRAVPNPFYEETTFSHGPVESVGDVSIYDIGGRLVRQLTSTARGQRTLTWDGRDRVGELVRPGVYFVRWADGDRLQCLKVARIQ